MVERGMDGFVQACRAWDLRRHGMDWDSVAFCLDVTTEEAKALVDTAECMNRTVASVSHLFK